MGLIDNFYRGKNVEIYEKQRSQSLKWEFETKTLIKIVRKLRNNIESMADAPVGTGRFIYTYENELQNKTIHLMDFSNDMLIVCRKKIKNNSGNRYLVEKIDLISNLINVEVDLLVCYRFMNLISWKELKKVMKNIFSCSNKYVICSIRLDEMEYDNIKIENKIYIQNRNLFFEKLKDYNFEIIELYCYKDERPGDYCVVLCEKKEV